MENFEILAWGILILGFFLAAVGTVIPGVPGAAFVLVGMVVHKYLMPEFFSWSFVTVIGVLVLVSWVVDMVSGVWGAKFGGASKKGIIGAAIGGFLGLPLGLPGLVMGPFVGAIIGDILDHRKDWAQLFKSGTGAALGFIISMMVRFFILAIMVTMVLLKVIMR